jgi:hypothetical protein
MSEILDSNATPLDETGSTKVVKTTTEQMNEDLQEGTLENIEPKTEELVATSEVIGDQETVPTLENVIEDEATPLENIEVANANNNSDEDTPEETLPMIEQDELSTGHEQSDIENPIEVAEEELVEETASAAAAPTVMIYDAEEGETLAIADPDSSDITHLTKEELMTMAAEAAKNEELGEAAQAFRKVRQVLDGIWNTEYQAARAQFIEEGGKPEDFKYVDPSRETFQVYYKEFSAKREDHRQKLEDEKLKNLQVKKDILEKIKVLAEAEESPNSIQQIKELQIQWKAIRAVPSELREELWNNYQYYLNKFYDNLSINNELKELDRRKNLEAKIELCKRMDELQHETSLKRSLLMHKKYWEEWKNTGPVPREANEEIFSRFKEAADKVFNSKMDEMKALDGERQGNLDKKIALCEKAEEFGNFTASSPKEWVAKIAEVNALFDEWKVIGPVSMKYYESIWDRFKNALNKFYQNKNQYFKEQEKHRAENLRLKQELCEKAEALQNNEDWGVTSKALIKLQEDWKKIGPIHDKQAEKMWNRFRSACDKFFERKNEHFADQQQDQTKNLEAKNAILAKLEELLAIENNDDFPNKVKSLQDEWATYGFVPVKQKEQIQKKYKDILDKLYNRIRKDFASNSMARSRNHYEVIARQNEGQSMLHGEERRIAERVRLLKTDIATWQNNMGFFANSKNASQFTKQIEDKIDQANRKLVELQQQLRVLRDVKTEKPKEKKVETPAPESEGVAENPEA